MDLEPLKGKESCSIASMQPGWTRPPIVTSRSEERGRSTMAAREGSSESWHSPTFVDSHGFAKLRPQLEALAGAMIKLASDSRKSNNCTQDAILAELSRFVENSFCIWGGLGEGITDLSNFVPRTRFWYLNERFAHRVEMLVRRESEQGLMSTSSGEELLHIAECLRVHHYHRVGHVIQMSPAQIQALTGASDESIETLNRDLATFDLHLGMKAIGWKPQPLAHWIHV